MKLLLITMSILLVSCQPKAQEVPKEPDSGAEIIDSDGKPVQIDKESAKQ